MHFLTRRLGRPCTALAHPNASSEFSQASMHGDRDTDVRAFREIVQKAALRRAVEQDRIPAPGVAHRDDDGTMSCGKAHVGQDPWSRMS